MKCHKCPYIDSIQRGDYTSKPWKDTPCAKCKLGEDTFYSVPFDEENPDCTAGASPAMSSFSERTAGFQPAMSSFSSRAADGSPAPLSTDLSGDWGLKSPGASQSAALSSDLRPPSSEDMMPTAVISSAIKGLLSLDPILRDIVAWRYQGLHYKEIAARQGSSTQLAEIRHKRALRDWPALQALFPEKMAKQARRKLRQ